MDRIYEHYKGGKYRRLGVAKHTETGESLVVYQSMADGHWWARPEAMFESMVTVEGKEVPRFKPYSE